MRVALGAFKTMGVPFSAAWRRALATLPRDDPDRAESLALLEWAKPAWRAGYEDVDYKVMAPAAAEWDDELEADETVLAFIGAAIGAGPGEYTGIPVRVVDPKPKKNGRARPSRSRRTSRSGTAATARAG